MPERLIGDAGPQGGNRHGTRSRYVRGCRCIGCTEANRLYHASLAERLQSQPIPEDAHGTTSTYDNRGCRCDLCREAKSIANAAYRMAGTTVGG